MISKRLETAGLNYQKRQYTRIKMLQSSKKLEELGWQYQSPCSVPGGQRNAPQKLPTNKILLSIAGKMDNLYKESCFDPLELLSNSYACLWGKTLGSRSTTKLLFGQLHTKYSFWKGSNLTQMQQSKEMCNSSDSERNSPLSNFQAIVMPPISESLNLRRKVPSGLLINKSWACCLLTKPRIALEGGKRKRDKARDLGWGSRKREMD